MSAAAAIQPEGLTAKRALVSGGTREIGTAIAARLTGAGATGTSLGAACAPLGGGAAITLSG